ncbi:Universal stress protein family protein [Nocardioides dokdonensis FR1436]|uniref:Universal stress protein family protein n=1 Tax=Nocardioides dokdonensis FR1436 TaxID=1300347 RepID=A0A1A9GMX6_9ACTN|nr:universal stress protein [Nocardioides dokdonensis]ANH39634.1 Universal stress protein family protein [Nocardioides dokdonensis FR1436]
MSQPDPRPVVVAVGDQPADAALSYAVAEAERLGCGVHLVHVVHSLPQGSELVRVQSVDVEDRGRHTLRRALDLARELAGDGPRVTASLLIGTVVHELVTAVEQIGDVRMVVVQHRDLSRVRRLVSRSTTGGLAARLRLPLVSVPASWTAGIAPAVGGVDRVVTAGVDEPERSVEVLRAAVAAARTHGARLDLVHAWGVPGLYDDPQLAEEVGKELAEAGAGEIRAQLDGLGVDFDDLHIEVHTPPQPAAEQLVEASRTAHLLVLGKHDPWFPLGSHVGPVTGAVLRDAQCPVLLVDPHPSD